MRTNDCETHYLIESTNIDMLSRMEIAFMGIDNLKTYLNELGINQSKIDFNSIRDVSSDLVFQTLHIRIVTKVKMDRILTRIYTHLCGIEHIRYVTFNPSKPNYFYTNELKKQWAKIIIKFGTCRFMFDDISEFHEYAYNNSELGNKVYDIQTKEQIRSYWDKRYKCHCCVYIAKYKKFKDWL